MLHISIVTYNRVGVLRRTLAALERHTFEPYQLLISDNGSSDGTSAFLIEYARAFPRAVDVWLLPKNVGIARARNAHWGRCVGHDTVRLDDKIEVQTPYWSQIMRRQATQHHALIAFTDPETEGLWEIANQQEVVGYPTWKCGAGMFIPDELTVKLGAWDEMNWPDGSPLLYGYEDLLWMDRAEALGWQFLYSLSTHARFLARASAESRRVAQEFEPFYKARVEEYKAGERDLFIDPAMTEGAQYTDLGQHARHAQVGTAMELPYP